jgi:DNA-binding transcriptional LysR family regulator
MGAPPMELRHLRYFLAVAEEGHMTRAAARLGLQQPPLSQQIRALEEELGTTLFVRLPRGVQLTPAGEEFLMETRAVLNRIEHAKAQVQAAALGQRGRISIGLTTSASLHPGTARLLRAFVETHPQVSLSLHADNAAGLTEALLREEVQVAIIRAVVARPSELHFEQLAKESMVIALPAKHHLARGKAGARGRLPLKALEGERMILVRRHGAPGMYSEVVSACRKAGFEPTIVAEVEHILTSVNLIAAGVGVSLVPASIQRIFHEGVAFRPALDAQSLVAPLTLVHRRGETRPVVKDFIELSRKVIKAESSKPSPGE